MVDAADATFRSQLDVTQSVLAEIGADQITSQLVLNKVDRLDAWQLKTLKHEFPDALFISTLTRPMCKVCMIIFWDFFEKDMTESQILVPYAHASIVAKIRSLVRITNESP